MNDMPFHVHNGKLLQDADDTGLICTDEDCCEVRMYTTISLQIYSIFLIGLATSSKMQLNIVKSSVIWLTSKPFSCNIDINIPPVHVYVYMYVHNFKMECKM